MSSAGTSNAIGWGGLWLSAVAVWWLGSAVAAPGGLKGRGVRGPCASMPNGSAVRRARVQFSRLSGLYPRGRCGERGYPAWFERAELSRHLGRAELFRRVRRSFAPSRSRKSVISGDSDRERVEGFQCSGSVAVASAVAVKIPSTKYVEGFQRSGSTAVAVTVTDAVALETTNRNRQPRYLSGFGGFSTEAASGRITPADTHSPRPTASLDNTHRSNTAIVLSERRNRSFVPIFPPVANIEGKIFSIRRSVDWATRVTTRAGNGNSSVRD